MARIQLTVFDNGPYKLSGENLTLRFGSEDVAVEAGSDIYLCRCGDSSNAPFCDGTHGKVGWVAEPPKEAKKKLVVWEGNTVRTVFNPNACMHVFKCKPLKELRKAELEGDSSAAAEIARVARSCPSGALRYEAKGDTDIPVPSALDGADVHVIEGGEIRIQVPFEVSMDLQEGQAEDRATLCRCGKSANKPWCDGAHKKREGFR